MTKEEAIQALNEIFDDSEFSRYEAWYGTAMNMAIEALQTDLVPCKDCRFWKNEHLCLVMSRYGRIDTKAEHYCSWGERREE